MSIDQYSFFTVYTTVIVYRVIDELCLRAIFIIDNRGCEPAISDFNSQIKHQHLSKKLILLFHRFEIFNLFLAKT